MSDALFSLTRALENTIGLLDNQKYEEMTPEVQLLDNVNNEIEEQENNFDSDNSLSTSTESLPLNYSKFGVKPSLKKRRRTNYKGKFLQIMS